MITSQITVKIRHESNFTKMVYRGYEEDFECICLVDNSTQGWEFTFCGAAIPDSRLDIEGFEAVGGEFKGSVKEVTCPNCRNRIQYIKKLR